MIILDPSPSRPHLWKLIGRTAVFLLLVLLVQVAGGLAAFGLDAPVAGPFSFVIPIAKISSDSPNGLGELILKSSAPQSTAPRLDDLALPAPPAATVNFDLVEHDTTTWRFKVTIAKT